MMYVSYNWTRCNWQLERQVLQYAHFKTNLASFPGLCSTCSVTHLYHKKYTMWGLKNVADVDYWGDWNVLYVQYHHDIFSTYRFPIHQGVGGYVARTGQLLNITRAYDSEIFNPAVDEMTGYTTHTLLCAPLTVQGKYVCCNSVW